MTDKLVIGEFQDKIVSIQDYHESVHYEKLVCPFCKVKINYTKLGFFKAWPGEGRHKCKDIKVNYFDADWDGKQYVEFINGESEGLKLLIDIHSITKNPKRYDVLNNNDKKALKSSDTALEFPEYKYKKKVFRDVVRSVYQMESIIRSNNAEALKNISYIFKTESGERLDFKDVVFKCNDIERAPIGKDRFFMFKVDTIVPIKDKNVVYINSNIIDGYQVSVVLQYKHDHNKLKKYKNEYVIAYGRVKSSNNPKKIFLNINNDYQIVKMREELGEELFQECKIENFKNQSKKEIRSITKFTTNSTQISNIKVSTKLEERYTNNSETISTIVNANVNKEINAAKSNISASLDSKSVDGTKNVDLYKEPSSKVNNYSSLQVNRVLSKSDMKDKKGLLDSILGWFKK